MPLPPALLKRLAKRGFVDKSKAAAIERPVPTEEIIAENYDEVDEEQPFDYDYDYKIRKKTQQNFWSERLKQRIVDGTVNGHKGCPNKVNIFHKCTLYCIKTFGEGIKEPSKDYLLRKQKLLRKYPLPRHWKEVYDEGVGVHYYWNRSDDTVSWLPPSHPKGKISRSAAAQRKEIEASQLEIDDNEDGNSQLQMENVEMDYTSDNNQSNAIREPPPLKLVPLKKPKSRDLDKVVRAKDERRKKKDASESVIDPMDPAAYSSCKRGKWSAGLETENRKTGVDSSVSGTMYQMRPYPSPGMILQANAKKGLTESQNSSENDNRDSDEV